MLTCLGGLKDDRPRENGAAVPWPSTLRSQRPPSGLGVFKRAPGARAPGARQPGCRASEALGAGQGAGLRRLVGARQTPAKPVMPVPPGPGAPGSLKKERDDEGRVYRAPAAGAARCSIAAVPGQLASNFPPTTELAQALRCKRSQSGGRRLCSGLSLFSDFPGGASGDGKGT